MVLLETDIPGSGVQSSIEVIGDWNIYRRLMRKGLLLKDETFRLKQIADRLNVRLEWYRLNFNDRDPQFRKIEN